MCTVGSDAIALVVGHDDQTARLASTIVAGVHQHHADTRFPIATIITIIITGGAFPVARDGLVAGYEHIARCGKSHIQLPARHTHQRGKNDLVAVGIYRRVFIGIEIGTRTDFLLACIRQTSV